MSTPIPPLTLDGPAAPADRTPLRLRLVTVGTTGHLDGGWWPRSRDLATEVADLVDRFPAHLGRVTRVLYSPSDWDGRVPQVRVDGRLVVAMALPRDDAHHVDVYLADGATLRLLVVPPDFSAADGEEALLAASTPGNAHSAADLLQVVTDEADVDPRDRWRDDGSAGWGYESAEPPPD